MRGRRNIPRDRIDEFFKRIEFIPFHSCWEWIGSKDVHGYGRMWLGGHKGKHIKAHHVSFELTHGLRNKDLCIDHICRNRGCVNPYHLRQVTLGINAMENSKGVAQANKSKKHCMRGHLLTGPNIIPQLKKSGTIGRICRECNNKWQRDRYHRIKNQILLNPAAAQPS